MFFGFVELGREIVECASYTGGEIFVRTPVFEPQRFCRNPKSDTHTHLETVPYAIAERG